MTKDTKNRHRVIERGFLIIVTSSKKKGDSCLISYLLKTQEFISHKGDCFEFHMVYINRRVRQH
jgi:hypothetical protein